jgi:hypothetical protein
MLSEKEIKFLQHWELVREKESGFMSKLSRGIPMACLFGLPILLLIAVIYFVSPDWYTKVSKDIDQGSIMMIVISVLIFILFFSYFRMHFKWEMNEQLYRELKSRQKKAEAANK